MKEQSRAATSRPRAISSLPAALAPIGIGAGEDVSVIEATPSRPPDMVVVAGELGTAPVPAPALAMTSRDGPLSAV